MGPAVKSQSHTVFRFSCQLLGITETDGLNFNSAEFTDNSNAPLSMFTLVNGCMWSEVLGGIKAASSFCLYRNNFFVLRTNLAWWGSPWCCGHLREISVVGRFITFHLIDPFAYIFKVYLFKALE